ncbi:MAG: hypothetical protein HQL11_00385 [Candidatus Omnitrophica bacterium]|nr:hypothetical protein [Candidatus Omnitrophota bacterium]
MEPISIATIALAAAAIALFAKTGCDSKRISKIEKKLGAASAGNKPEEPVIKDPQKEKEINAI